MTESKAPIPLSVVIPTSGEPGHVIESLDALRRQVSALNGQFMVVSGTGPVLPPPPDVWVHHVPGGSVFDCRAAGLSLAAGEIIAFTEDHCVHPPDWCARILHNFSVRPDLVLLGGAVANGSGCRLEDLMNYWTTFSTFAPGHVTARFPCISQLIVKASAVPRRLKPGELEGALAPTLQKTPGAIYVDPELIVRHDQSLGFWNTFVVHFHNGRSIGGLSPRRIDNCNLTILKSLWWGWRDARAHFRRSRAAFQAGRKPFHARVGYLGLILPLIVAHSIGAVVGYRAGPGQSAHRLT